MTRRNVLGFLLLCVGIAACGAAVWFFHPRQPAAETSGAPLDVAAFRKDMKELITTVGPETAYATFTERYLRADYNDQHIAAHIFGEALYETEGVRGVAVCDSAFSFGCFHGLFTRAIAAEGLDGIGMLNDACHSAGAGKVSWCQHGIGHGIMEYFGHGRLMEALRACKKTDQPNPVEGCTSGVFMEYTISSVSDTGTTSAQQILPFDPKKPYDICPSLSEDLQLSCYHELPRWWKMVFHYDLFPLGGLCDAVTGTENRYQCFSELADIVPPTTGFSVSKTIAVCDSFPKDVQALCRGRAAWGFFDDVHDAAGAAKVCDLPLLAEKKVCPPAQVR